MAETHESFQPNELSAPDGLHAQKVMVAVNAALAAGSQYHKRDICTVSTTDGTLAKFTSTTAADAARLCVAHQDYDPNPTGILETNPEAGKWHKVTRLTGRWVMNLVGTLASDPSGQLRNVAYDATDGVLKVQAGATSAAVRIISLAGDAAVGDTNAPVVVEFLDSVKL